MSWYNDQTLLSFLLEDFSLTDFIEYTEEMNELKQEQQWCLEHPDKTNEEDMSAGYTNGVPDDGIKETDT